jgi:hypothetical protein
MKIERPEGRAPWFRIPEEFPEHCLQFAHYKALNRKEINVFVLTSTFKEMSDLISLILTGAEKHCRGVLSSKSKVVEKRIEIFLLVSPSKEQRNS